MRAKLYVVAASHPCWAVARALELKGIDFTRVEWPPTMHVPMQRLRFGKGTVPGLVVDGERVVGSREIMHRLDELVPEPRLYPAEPDARARVEEIDRWAEQELQALARRLTWWVIRRHPAAMLSYAEDSRLRDARPGARDSSHRVVDQRRQRRGRPTRPPGLTRSSEEDRRLDR
jgi:glutathione S-transferase